jgi:hypothetical protein
MTRTRTASPALTCGRRKPSRTAGLIAVVFLAILVLGGGGGFAAWYVTTQQKAPNPVPSGTVHATTARTIPPTTAATGFDPHDIRDGDCIVNKGTPSDPKMEKSACTKGSFKVIKKLEGASIVENANGAFDADTTSVAACAGTGFQSWYGYKDVSDEKKDVFFCLLNNK